MGHKYTHTHTASHMADPQWKCVNNKQIVSLHKNVAREAIRVFQMNSNLEIVRALPMNTIHETRGNTITTQTTNSAITTL